MCPDKKENLLRLNSMQPNKQISQSLYCALKKYVHTCIHTYIHTCIQTYVHTYMHSYVRTYIVCMYMHTYVHMYIHTYVRTYIHTYIHCMLVHAYRHLGIVEPTLRPPVLSQLNYSEAPLYKDHLSLETPYSLSLGWSLYTGFSISQLY